MTVAQIANRVAGYVRQTRATLIDADDNDLVIAAMVNATRSIQQLHDFNYCQATAWVSIDTESGGSLTDAALVSANVNTATPVSVQRVDTVYLMDSAGTSTYWPLHLKDKKAMAIAAKEITYRYRGYPSLYYNGFYPDVSLMSNPDDPRNGLQLRPYQAYVQNNVIYLDPKPSTDQTVRMDCLTWIDEFLANTTVSVTTSSTASTSVTLTETAPDDLVVGTTFMGRLVTVVNGTAVTLAGNANATIAAATDVPYSNMLGFTTNEAFTNWFVDQAAEYLQWAAICEINMFTNTFVPRTDGYNSSPEKQRDRAAQALIEWDNFLWAAGQQPYSMR